MAFSNPWLLAWTHQALAMKREKEVSALDISTHEATLKGTSKEQLSADFTRMCSKLPSSARGLVPHKPGDPCGPRPETIGVPIQEEAA